MHVALIMDGNGRWATQRGLPRTAGHKAGAKAVDAAVSAAVDLGIEILTLYAFSAANWNRPKAEVSALFALFRRYLQVQTPRCLAQAIRINVIGRRDRLASDLCDAIERSEHLTAHCTRMQLRIAVDYSAQRSLMEAARATPTHANIDHGGFAAQLGSVDHCVLPATPVDLLIRTGGEQRLSDFLLWECAYAELLFLDCMWPDFDGCTLRQALQEYGHRQRRFGRIEEPRCVSAHA